MVNKTLKKIVGKNKNTTTKKNKETKAIKKLTNDQLQRLCKVSSNTFGRFEEEYEKSDVFIKKGMHTKSQVEKKLIEMIEVGTKDPLRPQDD